MTSPFTLSQSQRQLLAWLLIEDERRREGNPEERLELLNMGIPWHIHDFAAWAGVHTSAASRTLRQLEELELLACWATGQGRNRRVQHIKLSGAARRAAEVERKLGPKAMKVGQFLHDWW